MTIASHTIVKNGMPFIGKVLRQAAPLMNKMFISVSAASDDGTLREVMEFIGENPGKVEFMEDGYTVPGQLTQLRQFQVDRTKQDWILFLDDDDYWPTDQLELCLKELEKDDTTLAYSVSPYQVIDNWHYDASWYNKSFSKFLKKTDGLHYRGDWPRDLPCDDTGKPLYWKTHKQVKTLPYKFYHLALLKNHSFRHEDWAKKKYSYHVGTPALLESEFIL
ncbi:glycosyltransferase [Candidatus Roizmanbacteria bacterium]|nr:glycosyltransferase [Candidatus Roizmanbacteria bacterium]